MLLDRDHWERHCAGYTVYDCAIMDADRTFFVMVEDTGSPHRDPLPRTRFLFARANRPMDQGRFIQSEVGHFGFTEIAYGPAAVEFVACDTSQQVFLYDRNRTCLEADIPGAIPSSTLLATVTKVVRVGQTLFALGWPRRVYRRMGFESWAVLDSEMPLPEGLAGGDHDGQLEALTSYRLRDLAGFSESDMYAVGDAGEVWRFNGTHWARCAFPTDERLCTVACGPDAVYVTTDRGSIWVGRDDDWRLVDDTARSSPFRDSVWFAGRLWCGSDDGLWALEGSELVRTHIPPDILLVSGRLDVSPDGRHLLTAGARGAAMFDGAAWQLLFSAYAFA